MQRVALVLFTLVQFVIIHASAAETTAFKINLTSSGEKSKSSKLMKEIVKILYAQANYQVEFVHSTRKRESVLLQQAKIDAVLARYRHIGDAQPNLIRLEPELIKAYAIIICHNNEHCQSYRQTTIGYLQHFQYAKSFCTEQQLNCKEFNSEISLYRAMAAGFIDVMISYDVTIEMLKKIKFDNQIYVKKLQELSFNSYHYLHIKNKKYLSQLNHALKKLHQERVIEKMYEQFQYESLANKSIIILPSQ
ncbi:ABC transporter substrate-binding protein [Colwellia psychrerythraea]|uniref:Solute-binding protein family 3/N-terminal domain-containing protein n=1 Tax=Colwellia psychrerythraea TaxID=28229 RepID=A0A099KVM6_COLPS|nr:ABC transporter substrate-binding protein [Colwellia psychrerythraea]KGJ93922.1 hypothetical protein GAB14E_2477 [Colwellia psychrerythraea]